MTQHASALRRLIGPTECIRIRSTLRKSWVWEHLTADGHIVRTSAPFTVRSECEAEALHQGLPVLGLSRRATRAIGAQTMLKTRPDGSSLQLRKTADGLWEWRLVSTSGEELDHSTCAYLQKRECVADARRRFDSG